MPQARNLAILHTFIDTLTSATLDMRADNDLCNKITLASQLVENCRGTVFTAGNGGMAAQAQHFAAELTGRMSLRRRPIAALALTADSAVTTCIANDYGYERVFARPLEALAREGDIAVALTVSGRSRNILEMLAQARRMGVVTVTVTSRTHNRAIDELSDVVIALPAADAAITQQLALATLHAVAAAAEQAAATSDRRDPWVDVLACAAEGCDTLLLDRDGVINRLVPNGYVLSADQLVMEPAFLSVAKALADAFSRIIVVTNQKCVGRGKLSPEGLEAIHAAMTEATEAAGGRIDAIYCSTDTDPHSTMSKPATGLADCIAADHPDFDPARAVMAGDSVTDLLFAARIGARFVNIFNTDRP